MDKVIMIQSHRCDLKNKYIYNCIYISSISMILPLAVASQCSCSYNVAVVTL